MEKRTISLPDDGDYPPLERLRNGRILVTGGTGFVGTWLLDALLQADSRMNLGMSLFTLTRDFKRWQRIHPKITSNPAIRPLIGDIKNPATWAANLPDELDLLIHAAHDSRLKPGTMTPLQNLESLIDGTQHVVSTAVRRRSRRVLFISSGAVYGLMPEGQHAFREDFSGGLEWLSPGAAYAEGKRAAEAWANAYCHENNSEFVTARLFAFGGPFLPLDQHFAFGNFIADALAKRPIRVSGSGKSVRSWLAGSDLAHWLLTILLIGRDGRAYNVGSDEACTILELAHLVADAAGRRGLVELTGDDRNREQDSIYVPDISRARDELGLQVRVPLRTLICETLKHYELMEKRST